MTIRPIIFSAPMIRANTDAPEAREPGHARSLGR